VYLQDWDCDLDKYIEPDDSIPIDSDVEALKECDADFIE